MDRNALDQATDLRAREVPFVLATVVRREPPVLARPGDKAIVLGDGTVSGWIGGSCARAAVLEAALRSLVDGEPRLLLLHPDPETDRRPGVERLPMACESGGVMEIYLEPYLPAPRLVVMGASPVARALAGLARILGHRVYALGPGLSAEAFPEADAVHEGFRPPGVWAAGRTAAVVASLGFFDEPALEAALAERPDYVALVASRRRFAEVRRALAARGVPAAALAAVRNPAGIDIGARSPGEIAVSVLAEVIATRRQAGARTEAGAPRPSTDGPVARDPVCGMAVERARPAATADVGGTVYYFCCVRCRDAFLGAPTRRAG